MRVHAAFAGLFRRRSRPRPPAMPAPGYGAAVEASLDLDREISRKLDEAVARTETSALAIMEQVRALCDRSTELASRLQKANNDAAEFEQDITDNAAALAQLARFLECLPVRLQRDLACISDIAGEIKGLSGMAENVQAISMQSHLLSINAAIEASRAGSAGHAFKVVAAEVRALAANSHTAAAHIGGSLARIRNMLKEGLEDSTAESADDMVHIARVSQAVTRLQSSFDRACGSYRDRLSEMQQHGEALAAGTVDVLGQLQYQDVVRQCVERLQQAIAQRNAAFGQEFIGNPMPQPEVLARLVADITAEYLATEKLHGDGEQQGGAAPAIELF